MAIIATVNDVIVKVKTKWIKNISSITKMAAIQNNTSIEMADLVSIVGEVVSVPSHITTDKREYKGYTTNGINPGDTIIFSHQVIFNFEPTGPDEEPIFRNRIWYNGEEYFRADITQIFAIVKPDKIVMLNGYVMIEEMEKAAIIFLPTHVKKRIQAASGYVTQIGENLTHKPDLNIKSGDTVYYSPNHLSLYQVNNKPFGIIRQDHILGVKIPTYGEMAALLN